MALFGSEFSRELGARLHARQAIADFVEERNGNLSPEAWTAAQNLGNLIAGLNFGPGVSDVSIYEVTAHIDGVPMVISRQLGSGMVINEIKQGVVDG